MSAHTVSDDTRAFYAYVRGLSEDIPPGHSANGLRLYRHLVHLGASQLLQAQLPEVYEALGSASWQELISAFVRDSHWDSHFYGDLHDEFLAFLAKQAAQPD